MRISSFGVIGWLLVYVCATAHGAGFPPGRYSTVLQGDEWELRFDASDLRVFKNGQQVVASDYQVDGDQIRFDNDRGIYACIGEVSAGSYRWYFDQSGLHFVNIDDQCPGRISVLTANPWRIKGGATARIMGSDPIFD